MLERLQFGKLCSTHTHQLIYQLCEIYVFIFINVFCKYDHIKMLILINGNPYTVRMCKQKVNG